MLQWLLQQWKNLYASIYFNYPSVWLIEVQVSGRLFGAWQWEWDHDKCRNLPCERAKPYEKSLMAVKIVCMHNGLLNLNLWISDLRNCWQLLITIGLHKIVSGGRIVIEYSCYASKHKIIMGIVVLLTRDPQLRITSLERIWGQKWASKGPKCTIKINQLHSSRWHHPPWLRWHCMS